MTELVFQRKLVLRQAQWVCPGALTPAPWPGTCSLCPSLLRGELVGGWERRKPQGSLFLGHKQHLFWIELYPLKIHMLKPKVPGRQNVTSFGSRVTADVIS